MAGFLKQQ